MDKILIAPRVAGDPAGLDAFEKALQSLPADTQLKRSGNTEQPRATAVISPEDAQNLRVEFGDLLIIEKDAEIRPATPS